VSQKPTSATGCYGYGKERNFSEVKPRDRIVRLDAHIERYLKELEANLWRLALKQYARARAEKKEAWRLFSLFNT
jgi:hypothetical protein